MTILNMVPKLAKKHRSKTHKFHHSIKSWYNFKFQTCAYNYTVLSWVTDIKNIHCSDTGIWTNSFCMKQVKRQSDIFALENISRKITVDIQEQNFETFCDNLLSMDLTHMYMSLLNIYATINIVKARISWKSASENQKFPILMNRTL